VVFVGGGLIPWLVILFFSHTRRLPFPHFSAAKIQDNKTTMFSTPANGPDKLLVSFSF